MVRFSVLLISTFIISKSVLAEAVTERFDIVRLGVNVEMNVLFITVNREVAGHNTCPTVRNELLWDLNRSGSKEIYSTALLAFSLGKSVSIGVTKGSKCVLGQPTGEWLYLKS